MIPHDVQKFMHIIRYRATHGLIWCCKKLNEQEQLKRNHSEVGVIGRSFTQTGSTLLDDKTNDHHFFSHVINETKLATILEGRAQENCPVTKKLKIFI